MARRKRGRHTPPHEGGAGSAASLSRASPQPLEAGGSDSPAGEQTEGPDSLKPWLLAGACALWVARPLLVSESAAEEGDGLPVVMLWLALAVVWLLGAVGRKRFAFRLAGIDAAVLAVAGLHVLAGIRGALVGHPRPAVNMVWEWVGLGVGYTLTRQVLDKGSHLRAVAVVMAALAVGLAGYGIYQYAYELPATRAEYRRNPEKVLREAGLDVASDPALLRRFEDRLNSPEPIATFALTNSLAGLLAPWLVFLAGIGAAGWPSGGNASRRFRIARAAVAFSAALVAGCLILTMSRSAYLATALGLVVLAGGAMRSWRRKWLVLAGGGVVLGALAVAAVATGGVDASVFTQAGRSLGVRLHYWRATAAMIAEHPWLGVGPGNFQAEYTRYKLPQASEEVAEPHNFVLEVWATAGALALFALAVVLGQLIYRVAIAVKRSEQRLGLAADASQQGDAPPRCSGGPLWAAAGGVAGYPLGLLVGWTTSAPPSVPGVLLAMLLAGGVIALLWPWVIRGRLPIWLAGLALAVLLANLLAAGAMAFPGVAGSLWLLAGMIASRAEQIAGQGEAAPPSESGPHRRPPLVAQAQFEARGPCPHHWPPLVAWTLLAAALAAVVACYSTAYGPVLECRAAMAAARRLPDHAEPLLLRAAQADPLASRPWEMLAALRYETWNRRHDPAAAEALQQATQAMLQRAPKASALWLATADRYIEIYRHTGQRVWLEDSLRAYQQAAELYPANAWVHARWALACEVAGDEAAFARHARDALRLDDLADPASQRLPPELRRRLERNELRGG